MSRIKQLTSIGAGPALAMLAMLLLLVGLAFPGITRAQDDETAACIVGLELPAELAELDLAGVQAALQEMVDADPKATVTLLFEGEVVATVRAELLLADEAALAALLEGQPVNVTVEFPQGEEGLAVIVAIEVSTAEDCTFPDNCIEGIELPAALADLDVAGLRAALEELIAGDVDATVTLQYLGDEFVVRADLLLGLSDPVLDAVLAGDPLSVSLRVQGETLEIVGIALPGPECEGVIAEPTVVAIPDNQQGGDKETTPDNQQGGWDKVTDNQQTGGGKDTGAGGKTPDNQQGGGKVPDNQQGGGGETVTKTFELTLNGAVPTDQAFGVVYSTSDDPEELIPIALCGQPGGRLADKEDCRGGGTEYTADVEVVAGTTIKFVFFRVTEGDPESYEAFHLGTETINADITNTAYYTFGKGTGAGDEQEMPDNQQEGEKPDTGADEVPDNQQEGDDKGAGGEQETPDNQQGEIPEELPETGAGGLGPVATIPVGNAMAGLGMLVGAGYAVLRRR